MYLDSHNNGCFDFFLQNIFRAILGQVIRDMHISSYILKQYIHMQRENYYVFLYFCKFCSFTNFVYSLDYIEIIIHSEVNIPQTYNLWFCILRHLMKRALSIFCYCFSLKKKMGEETERERERENFIKKLMHINVGLKGYNLDFDNSKPLN